MMLPRLADVKVIHLMLKDSDDNVEDIVTLSDNAEQMKQGQPNCLYNFQTK